MHVKDSWNSVTTYDYIDGWVQERRNSIANALELRLSCTNPMTSSDHLWLWLILIMDVICIYADEIENPEHHELKICRLDWFLKSYWY